MPAPTMMISKGMINLSCSALLKLLSQFSTIKLLLFAYLPEAHSQVCMANCNANPEIIVTVQYENYEGEFFRSSLVIYYLHVRKFM